MVLMREIAWQAERMAEEAEQAREEAEAEAAQVTHAPHPGR